MWKLHREAKAEVGCGSYIRGSECGIYIRTIECGSDTRKCDTMDDETEKEVEQKREKAKRIEQELKEIMRGWRLGFRRR